MKTVHTSVSRRRFLGIGAGLAAATFAHSKILAFGKEKNIPVALQLYSVRMDCGKDFLKTIEAVAKIGYQGVEFAGYYGVPATQIRIVLDDNGLKVAGSHTNLDTLIGDNLKQTIEFNQILGNRNLILPWLPESYRDSKKAWLKTAEMFNELVDKVTPAGMRIGYHNHAMEFDPIGGEMPWDIFAQNTRKEVILQFDTGNAGDKHVNPLDFLKKYPGRSVTIHMKEYSSTNPTALMGEGDIPFKEIIQFCRDAGGTEWFIIEEENESLPPLETVEKNFHNFNQILKSA